MWIVALCSSIVHVLSATPFPAVRDFTSTVTPMLCASFSLLPLADAWGMHDGDIGAGWMIVIMLGMLLFWGLVAVGIVWLLRDALGRGHRGPGEDPLAILNRRLAEGELSIEDYEQRKRALET